MPLSKTAEQLTAMAERHQTHTARWFVVGNKMQAIEGDIQAALLSLAEIPGLSARQVQAMKVLTMRLKNAKEELAEVMGEYFTDYQDAILLINGMLKP